MVESQPPLGPVLRFGVFELDRRTGELRKSGLRVGLQEQPLQVLTMLLERRGELVTREELRQRLWPADTFVDFEQGLNAAVKRLRTALGDSADVPRFIETLPRRGYRWAHLAEPAGPLGADAPAVVPTRRGFPTRLVVVAAMAVALSALALAWWKRSRPASTPPPSLRATVVTTLSGAELDLSPALSPDRKRVAFCRTQGVTRGVWVKDVDSGGEVRLADGLAGAFNPTWSPDGREIAFLRRPNADESREEIVTVPAEGGSERRLGTTLGAYDGLDWSPDGRTLAFVDKVSASGPDAIHLLTIETGERYRLTTPVGSSPDVGDNRPSFSPDGRSVAFIRRGSGAPTSTDLYVHEVGSSDSRPVTSGYGVRDVAWAPDGRSLVFVGGRPQQGVLWVVGATGGTVRRLDGGHVGVGSIGRVGRTLWFEERVVNSNVWRASGPELEDRQPRRPLTTAPRQDAQPDSSPDGRHIAFAHADEAGMAIRVCAADGTDCFDFESASNLSRPQWSPDGKSLAVVGWQGDEPLDVYRLEIDGRFVRRLTMDNAIDTMPTWSRDGRWLYFASDRSGRFEIWKMPSTGGEPRQLTRDGGIIAFETADGRSAYFTNAGDLGTLWRMPAEGGDAVRVLDQPIHFGKWTLWRDRVVYVDVPASGPQRVMMFDPATGQTSELFSLDRPSGSGIAVAPDGAWILYTQRDDVTSDILVVEGLE